jgi:hypothetical protein
MSPQNNDHGKLQGFARLPARLIAAQAAELLGFAAHDIPVLIKAKLLTPLGKPAPNAVKFFAAVTVEELACNTAWLAKATAAIYGFWLNQNTRRRPRAASMAPGAPAIAA